MNVLLLSALRNHSRTLYPFYILLVLSFPILAESPDPTSGLFTATLWQLDILDLHDRPFARDSSSPLDSEGRVERARLRLENEAKSVFGFQRADAEALFSGSKWVILSDRFGFLPPPAFLGTAQEAKEVGGSGDHPNKELIDLRASSFILFGQAQSIPGPDGTLYEIHGTRRDGAGGLFTIDGFARPQDGQYMIDVVYSFAVRGLRQAGHARLQLAPVPALPAGQSGASTKATSPAPPDNAGPGQESSPETPEELWKRYAEMQANDERRMWEGQNDTYFLSLVEGYRFGDTKPRSERLARTKSRPNLEDLRAVQLARFDVLVEGEADGQPFGPFPGILMLSKSKTADQDISLMLVTEDFSSGPVGSVLLAPSESADWQVEVADGHVVNAQLKDPADAGFTGFQWHTLETPAAREPTTAGSTEAELSLSVSGNRIEGRLSAEGYMMLDATKPSRYSATIEGELHRERIVEDILSRIDVIPMSGRWQTHTEGIEEIRLDASADARTGRFGPTQQGTIEGSYTEGLLRFTWAGSENRNGWGFLRPVWGGARAVGIWSGGPEGGTLLPLVAEQPQQPLENLNTAEVTAANIDEIKNIGRDLADQGKCEQALSVLDLAWNHYEQRGRGTNLSDMEVTDTLMNQSILVVPMLQCSFELGRYQGTVEYLRKALDIERENHPVKRAKSQLADRVHRFAAELRDNAGQFSTLKENLELITAPKIGLSFDPTPDVDLLVTAVAPNGPAAKAGLEPGDRILSIDGKSTRGAQSRELVEAFAGAEGTSVRLELAHEGGSREISVVREPWSNSIDSEARRRAVERGVAAMREADERVAAMLIAQAEDLSLFEPQTARNGSGLEREIDSVIDRLKTQNTQMDADAERLIALGESLFGTWDKYMPRQRWLVGLVKEMTENPGQVPSIEPLSPEAAHKPVGLIEDEMVAELGSDPQLATVEAGLFHEHFKSVATLYQIKGVTAIEIAHLLRMKELHRNVTGRLSEQLNQVADLSGWLERIREDVPLDAEKIATLDLGKDFYSEWVGFLWELEEDLRHGGGPVPELSAHVTSLLATEAARNRAAQDLFASRRLEEPRISSVYSSIASRASQKPLTADELVALSRKRGGTTLAYYALADRLLVWVVDNEKLACSCKPSDAFIRLERLNEESLGELSDELNARVKGDLLPSPSSDWTDLRCDCNGIVATELPVSQKQIRSDWERFKDAVEPKDYPDEAATWAFLGLLHDLYGKLVEPIRNLLPSDPEAVVTVIPDGKLFEMPFGAFISKANRDPTGIRYMIQDHPMAYLASIGMMRFTQENRERAAAASRPCFVALLNPSAIAYSDQVPFAKIPDDALESYGRRWATHYPTMKPEIYVGKTATLDNALGSAPQAGVLTLLTHAQTKPLGAGEVQPFIALGEAPLDLDKAGALRLAADLVVLAGCQTGLGEVSADGVLGLSRAFTLSGAPSLLMSLWEVPWPPTLAQIDWFHGFHGAEGLSKARALQEAQKKAIENNPYYAMPSSWAGLVLFGEP